MQATTFGQFADCIQGHEKSMNSITLKAANQIIDRALAKAREQSYQPMAVVVLDDAGHVRALQREDGASMFRVDIAIGKAWATVGMGVSSRTLADRARSDPNFFVTLAATARGKFLPHAGAVLIKNGTGNIIGAAGASGGRGDEDELICIAGIEDAGLVHG